MYSKPLIESEKHTRIDMIKGFCAQKTRCAGYGDKDRPKIEIEEEMH
jgi:hypothetical protein